MFWGSTVVVTNTVCGTVLMYRLKMSSVYSCATLSRSEEVECSHEL